MSTAPNTPLYTLLLGCQAPVPSRFPPQPEKLDRPRTSLPVKKLRIPESSMNSNTINVKANSRQIRKIFPRVPVYKIFMLRSQSVVPMPGRRIQALSVGPASQCLFNLRRKRASR